MALPRPRFAPTLLTLALSPMLSWAADSVVALDATTIEERASEYAFLRQQFERTRVSAPVSGLALFDDPSGWIGKPLARLDVRDKSTGKAQYAIDLRVDGMLYAVIARPPVYGGKVKSVDSSAALTLMHEHLDRLEAKLDLGQDHSL